MVKALRGMKDIFDIDSIKFNYFIENSSKIAKKYGFGYIETPIAEETALFKRSVGESSDIVNKEMYQFIDKGGNDICLRPEGTAGVVRSFIENKFDKAGGVYRFYYHGQMFRYERPQKGRFRQFHQFGCESFGISDVYEDALIIMMIKDIFDFFGIKHTIKLNSLGCSACMPTFKNALIEFLDEKKETLCEDCNNRIKTNPIRVLDCKISECKEIVKNSPKMRENLCSSCDEDFTKLLNILDENRIKYEIDLNLVRGLDYYTKSAFEFVSDEIGSQSSIAGGGRYDKLVEFLGGKSTPAVGFAIGVERVLELIKMNSNEQDSIYIGCLDEKYLPKIFTLAKKLRQNSTVFVEYKAKNLKNHLKGADKLNARYCYVLGENEIEQNSIWMKDLVLKNEQLISLGGF
ncbi:MAG: histidine--tRNA ligase [Campylobacterales bacterium]|nr:histidine--tRNA ligase [Campylobacterales bacterium]